MLDMDSVKLLYTSLVRAHLEYSNVIVYPQFEKQAKLLEGGQRRATKIVPEIKLPGLYRESEEA